MRHPTATAHAHVAAALRELRFAFRAIVYPTPRRALARDVLDVLERRLIDGEESEAVPVAPLPGSLVLENVGSELHRRRVGLAASVPIGRRQNNERRLVSVVDGERVVGRAVHAQEANASVLFLAPDKRATIRSSTS